MLSFCLPNVLTLTPGINHPYFLILNFGFALWSINERFLGFGLKRIFSKFERISLNLTPLFFNFVANNFYFEAILRLSWWWWSHLLLSFIFFIVSLSPSSTQEVTNTFSYFPILNTRQTNWKFSQFFRNHSKDVCFVIPLL